MLKPADAISPITYASAAGVTFENIGLMKQLLAVGDHLYVTLTDPLSNESDIVKIKRTDVDLFYLTSATGQVDRIWESPCIDTSPTWLGVKEYICQCKEGVNV